MITARRWALAGLYLFASALGAQTTGPQHDFEWMRACLAEYSLVTVAGAASGTREVLSTRLDPIAEPGRASLVYERATYSGASESLLRSRQIIHYTLSTAALDPASVAIQPGQETGTGGKMWAVGVSIRGGAELVPYTNLVEARKADGTVDVTTSRSRVRQVVLGYFPSEALAKELAEAFRAWLAAPPGAKEAPKPAAPPPVKPLSRSSA